MVTLYYSAAFYMAIALTSICINDVESILRWNDYVEEAFISLQVPHILLPSPHFLLMN